MSLRLVGVSRGDPRSPITGSGVPKHLFDALGRRYELVDLIDVSLRPWQRAAAAAVSLHPSRVVWRERFYRHPIAFELQSRNSRAQLPERSTFDLAVQVFALFQTRGAPYVADLDTTHELSRRLWPEWSPYDEKGVQRWYARERRTYLEAGHLFARTRAVAQSLTGFYGVPEDRVSVVGGGFTFDQLPDVPANRSEPLVLFVGREWRRKGGDTLVEAVRAVRVERPDARLVVVGTDEPAEEPGVEVRGRIDDRAELASLYRRAAVFCLPSLYDPYPGAAMEAMAWGLPTIVADAGGTADIVDDGRAGVIVPPGDPVALARELLALLNDGERAARLGAAGRKRVASELNWDAVVRRMEPGLEAAATAARTS